MPNNAAAAAAGAGLVVFPNWLEVKEYAQSIVEGRKEACDTLKKTCWRFLGDLKNPAYEIRHEDAEFVAAYIQSCCFHSEGEAPDGTPLLGKPIKLEPWQLL